MIRCRTDSLAGGAIRATTLFALVASVATGWGAESFLFGDNDMQWNVVHGERRGGVYRSVNSEKKPEKSVARFAWSAEHASFLELHSRTRPAIAALQEKLDATADLRVLNPGYDIERISLRLQDARGAIYQWKERIRLPARQWTEITYDITPEDCDDRWSLPQDGSPAAQPPMRLLGIAVGLREEEGKSGHILVDRVRFHGPSPLVSVTTATGKQKQVPALRALEVSLATPAEPFPIMRPGADEHIALTIRNSAREDIACRIEADLSDFDGHVSSAGRNLALKPGESVSWRLPIRADRESVWWVDYTLSTLNKEAKETGRLSLAVFDPAGPDMARNDGFLFGLCNHTERHPPEEQEIEARAAGLVGADVMRSGVTWGSIQPEPDVWDWTQQDRIVRLFGEQGVEVQYLLAFTPKWATTGDPESEPWKVWSRKAPEIDAWSRFCRAIAERYTGKIRFWEVWNEPDLDFFRGTADEYLEMLRAAYREIKAVNDTHRVMTGGFATWNRNPEFVEKVVREGRDHFDILAWHQHGPFQPFAQKVRGGLAHLRETVVPDKPLVFNETAVATWSLTGEREQAEQLVKKLTFSWSVGARGYWWYMLRDDAAGSAEGRGVQGWGLLKYNLQPRAAYVAYNAMVKTLKGMEFDRRFDLGANRWLLGFQGENRYVLVAWVEPPQQAHELLLETGAENVRVIDLMGNADPVPIAGEKSTSIRIGDRPQYVVLDGVAARPKLAGSLLELQGPPLLVPGEEAEVRFFVRNPLPERRRFEAELSLPDSIGGAILRETTEVPADSRRSATFRFHVPSGVSGAHRELRPAALHYTLDDSPFSGTLDVPLHVAIAAGKPDDKPEFVLRKRVQVVSLFGNDPNTRHLVWEGPSDLSATVGLQRDSGDLVVRTRVRDDRHAQPYDGTETWRGDNVQIALQVPGQEGMWRMDLARLDSGEELGRITRSPSGMEAGPETLRYEVRKDGRVLVYTARLSLEDLGLAGDDRVRGFRFTLLVNDNDAGKREGWIAVSKGIGSGDDPSLWPYVVLDSG